MATKYISLQAAIETVLEKPDMTPDEKASVVVRLNAIMPSDVVEVVRCKDCRYYYKDEDGYEMCDNTECYDHISADGFCAWAKRRQTHDIMGYAR